MIEQEFAFICKAFEVNSTSPAYTDAVLLQQENVAAANPLPPSADVW